MEKFSKASRAPDAKQLCFLKHFHLFRLTFSSFGEKPFAESPPRAETLAWHDAKHPLHKAHHLLMGECP